MAKALSVAEAKRRFSDVLGSIYHRGERVVVERRGRPIAAIAVASDRLLVTGNVKHFARVPGLRSEDWMRR